MLKNLLVDNSAPATSPWINANTYNTNIFGSSPTLGGAITAITNIIIAVGLGLVIVFLAMGFIKFITSQGDKVATEQAQKWVTYAIIGGVGLFLVWAIKSLLINFLNVSDPLNQLNE